jgi:O-succinylbenzoic acid--CoA ligase
VLKNLIFLTEDKQLQKEVTDFLTEWSDPSPTLLVKTSGSTGKPKEMEVLKEHMRISARKTISTFSISAGGTAFLCLSLETIAGKMMVVRAFENEMTLYVGDNRSTACCELPISEFDLMAVVPLQLESGMKCNSSLLRKSKTILVGGGTISSEQLQHLGESGITVFHTYGMTETLTHIAFRRAGAVTDERFTPLSGVNISVEEGCLRIDYPELDIENLVTSDLVTIDPTGHFQITGRADFAVNSGGIKFHPEELEARIGHIIQKPFFIGSLPDPQLGEKLVLILEGIPSENDKDILQLIKPMLPKHGYPKEICYVHEFLRTESLKIRRKETLEIV